HVLEARLKTRRYSACSQRLSGRKTSFRLSSVSAWMPASRTPSGLWTGISSATIALSITRSNATSSGCRDPGSVRCRREAQDITKLYSLRNVLHQVRSYVPRGVRRRRQRFAVITRNVAASSSCPSQMHLYESGELYVESLILTGILSFVDVHL